MEAEVKIKRKDRVVFRVGDHIEVINPLFFLRCGYPLSFQEVREEIRNKYSDEISSFIKKIKRDAMGLDKQDVAEQKDSLYDIIWTSKIKDRTTEEVVKDVSYYVLKKRNFGGSERLVHTVEIPELKNKEFVVVSKKICYSGTYGHGGGGWGEDYEPNYLANTKAHVILYIEESGYLNGNGWIAGTCYDKLKVHGKTYPLAIEACNIKNKE